jgi:hypothetical protein
MHFDADRYFAAGGPANVSPAQREAGNYPKQHERVAGLPVSIENPKGSTRVREDSGPAKMAADYGYIVGSAKDADKMDVDTYVGPHKDSDKVFVINQQHPHSKRFNEHKVMLGYKDRKHALHDYVHSFADGLGHKRVHSIVEMGKHELKDWMKNGRHTMPIKKADGGEIDLTARKQAVMDPRKALLFGESDQALPPAGLPIGQAVGTKAAAEVVKGLMAGSELTKQAIEEGKSPDYNNPEDVEKVLSAAGAGLTGGIAAPVGGAGVVLGAGPVRRELSPLGFYSHAAEVASELPQAKGSPEQIKSMLKKAGVKDAELEGFDEAFAGQKSVTKDEVAQHFNEKMPQVEETVLGAPNKDLQKTWEKIDRLSNELYDLGITEHTPIARGTYNPDFYPAEYQGIIKELADAYKYVRDQESLGRTMAANPTKFSQYTLPGGENYREVRLTLPKNAGASKETSEKMMMLADRAKKAQKAYDDELLATLEGTSKLSNAEFEALRQEADYAKSSVRNFEKIANKPLFESSHWPDAPNTIAHLRMSDRTGPNGEKILHVEEIQSDWGQQGKKEGFKHPGEPAGLSADETARFRELINIPQIRRTPAQQTELDALNATGDRRLKAPPPAPYVTNTQAWTDLALKRALKEAAEGGYDKLVWTPGVEQAKRYDLSTHVDRIAYDPEEKTLSYVQKGRGGQGWTEHPGDVEPKDLPEIIGKEAAEKLLAQEPNKLNGIHSLEAPDLVFGGEGMKGYYDKIVPNQLSKLVKKLDPEAKVEMGRLPVEGRNKSASDIASELNMSIEQINALPDAEKRALIGSVRHSIAAPSLTITPKMREAIMKGQSAYAEGGKVEARKPSVGHPSSHIALVGDIRKTAKEHGLQKPAMTHLIKMMGIPNDRAAQYAHNVLTDPQLHHKVNPATEKFLITLHGAMKHTAAKKYTSELRRHLRDRVIYGNP